MGVSMGRLGLSKVRVLGKVGEGVLYPFGLDVGKPGVAWEAKDSSSAFIAAAHRWAASVVVIYGESGSFCPWRFANSADAPLLEEFLFVPFLSGSVLPELLFFSVGHPPVPMFAISFSFLDKFPISILLIPSINTGLVAGLANAVSPISLERTLSKIFNWLRDFALCAGPDCFGKDRLLRRGHARVTSRVGFARCDQHLTPLLYLLSGGVCG